MGSPPNFSYTNVHILVQMLDLSQIICIRQKTQEIDLIFLIVKEAQKEETRCVDTWHFRITAHEKIY